MITSNNSHADGDFARLESIECTRRYGMATSALSFSSLVTSIIPEFFSRPETSLSVSGDRLKITGRHTTRFQHIIDDLGIKVNGKEIEDAGFETRIRDKSEEVTILLPFEPQPGDVITVDTAVHSLGSKKITLRVE